MSRITLEDIKEKIEEYQSGYGDYIDNLETFIDYLKHIDIYEQEDYYEDVVKELWNLKEDAIKETEDNIKELQEVLERLKNTWCGI